MMLALLLTAFLVPNAFQPVWTPEQVAALRATPIGQTVTFEIRENDGCNTCTVTYRRVSETEVEELQDGSCTLVNCYTPPRYQFDPPAAKERTP